MCASLYIGWLILWQAVILCSLARPAGQFGGIGDPSSALHSRFCPGGVSVGASKEMAKPLTGAIRTPLASPTACHLFHS